MHSLLSRPGTDSLSHEVPTSKEPLEVVARVSVVVPVGPGDCSWRELLGCLAKLPNEAEVWLIATEAEPGDLACLKEKSGIGCSIHWQSTAVGRARQMNTGARLSQREFLWFLHADSRFPSESLTALADAIATAPEAIHYFDLQFLSDGPALARLNTWGVWLRTHWLRLPFGDQGFVLRRDTFERLSGFPENVPYGEDHLFVWQAHRQRIPLQSVGATIFTSARKYRTQGWLATTAVHVWRTWAQALPQFFALLRSRVQ